MNLRRLFKRKSKEKEEFEMTTPNEVFDEHFIRNSSELPHINLSKKWTNANNSVIQELVVDIKGDTIKECHDEVEYFIKKWKVV